MKFKRFLALVLSMTLVLSLVACGNQGTNDDANNGSSSVVSDNTYADMANAYTQQIAALDKDTVLFTVNGQDVTAEFYLYWLTYDCYYWDYMNQTYYGTALDFTAAANEEMTVAEYLRDDAKSFATYYIVMEQHAAANNCTITDEQIATWDKQKADYIANNGQEAFDLLMSQWGVTMDTFDCINTYPNLYSNLQDLLVGEPTAEDLASYIEANKIYAAKHILILTAKEDEKGNVTLSTGSAITNEDGSAYTGTVQEYNAEALARAKDIAAQLESAEDPIALFDELMNKHSEDTGLKSNPDGYTFTTGQMVTEFEEGTKALEYGEISEIVESTFGYHIILRLEPEVTDDCANALMDAKLDQWMADAEVVTTEAYEAIDAGSVYEKYVAYQTALTATEEESATDGE